MTDISDVWQRAEPDSPCQAICLIDPATRLCIGCKRTGDEIAAWPRMSREQRVNLLSELAARESPKARRSGGRAARIKRKL